MLARDETATDKLALDHVVCIEDHTLLHTRDGSVAYR
jgi:hypothetical protein